MNIKPEKSFIKWLIEKASGFKLISIISNGSVYEKILAEDMYLFDLENLNSKDDFELLGLWKFTYYPLLLLRASVKLNIMTIRNCDYWNCRNIFSNSFLSSEKKQNDAREVALKHYFRINKRTKTEVIPYKTWDFENNIYCANVVLDNIKEDNNEIYSSNSNTGIYNK